MWKCVQFEAMCKFTIANDWQAIRQHIAPCVKCEHVLYLFQFYLVYRYSKICSSPFSISEAYSCFCCLFIVSLSGFWEFTTARKLIMKSITTRAPTERTFSLRLARWLSKIPRLKSAHPLCKAAGATHQHKSWNFNKCPIVFRKHDSTVTHVELQ